MRITPTQRERVRKVVREQLGRGARVWLFGSRADDRKRGGDVDLYVEAEGVDDGERLRRVIATQVALEDVFDGARVDLVVRFPDEPAKPIHTIAKRTGIEL